jgi:hypothetical protein
MDDLSKGLNRWLKRELKSKGTFPHKSVYNGLSSDNLDEVSLCIRVCGTSDYYLKTKITGQQYQPVFTTKMEEARVFKSLSGAYQRALDLVEINEGIPTSIESVIIVRGE